MSGVSCGLFQNIITGRAQGGLAAKCSFQSLGGQFRDAGIEVLTDPLQDIDQVAIEIDIVGAASSSQALRDVGMFYGDEVINSSQKASFHI